MTISNNDDTPDLPAINKAILNVDLALIEKEQSVLENLESQLRKERQMYDYYQKLFADKEAQVKLLETIKAKGEKIKEQIAKHYKKPDTLTARADANYKLTQKDIAGLLIWLNNQFNISNPLQGQQMVLLTDTIIDTYGFLMIEEIADCFKKVVMKGEKLNNAHSLDPATVMNWLKKYYDDKLEAAANLNLNKHLSTK